MRCWRPRTALTIKPAHALRPVDGDRRRRRGRPSRRRCVRERFDSAFQCADVADEDAARRTLRSTCSPSIVDAQSRTPRARCACFTPARRYSDHPEPLLVVVGGVDHRRVESGAGHDVERQAVAGAGVDACGARRCESGRPRSAGIVGKVHAPTRRGWRCPVGNTASAASVPTSACDAGAHRAVAAADEDRRRLHRSSAFFGGLGRRRALLDRKSTVGGSECPPSRERRASTRRASPFGDLHACSRLTATRVMSSLLGACAAVPYGTTTASGSLSITFGLARVALRRPHGTLRAVPRRPARRTGRSSCRTTTGVRP